MKHLSLNTLTAQPRSLASILGKIANESEIVGGKAQVELEFAVICKLNDRTQLDKAVEVIYQQQAAIRGKVPGTQLRMRKAIALDPKTLEPIQDPQYIFTGKAPFAGSGLKEKNLAGDQEMLDIFIIAAQEYVEKIRYEIPSENIPGGKPWQIDTFKDADGGDQDFVKIDLEIPEDSGFMLTPEAIPFDVSDVAISFKGKLIHGSQEVVDNFYANVFSKKLG